MRTKKKEGTVTFFFLGWDGGIALRSSACLQNERANFASLRYAEPADFC